MRLVKAPRATWETCGHRLTSAIGVALIALAVILGIAAIWTVSDKLGMTATLLGCAGILTGVAGAVSEADAACRRDRTITVPLPWRRRVEDER